MSNCLGFRCQTWKWGTMGTKGYLDVEYLEVYRKLCRLHIDVCGLTHKWPQEERYELGSQVRRSSNSAPAQLAEKNDDRHVRNKIEGVNRGTGEAAETIHHLYMAKLKGYVAVYGVNDEPHPKGMAHCHRRGPLTPHMRLSTTMEVMLSRNLISISNPVQ